MNYKIDKGKKIKIKEIKQGELFLDPDSKYVYMKGVLGTKTNPRKVVAIGLELGEVIKLNTDKLVYAIEIIQEAKLIIKNGDNQPNKTEGYKDIVEIINNEIGRQRQRIKELKEEEYNYDFKHDKCRIYLECLHRLKRDIGIKLDYPKNILKGDDNE